MRDKTNPFEAGRAAALAYMESRKTDPAAKHPANPEIQFSTRWGLWNKGFNTTAYPDYFNQAKNES